MLDQWFLKDVNKVLDHHAVVVLVDESGEAEFLLSCLPGSVKQYRCATDLEELHVKYQVEKAGATAGAQLIYTQRPLSEQRYLREYVATNGAVHIKYLHNYIKAKVHEELQLNLHLKEEDIASAGKLSIGKAATYWMDLCHKGATQLFDLEKELFVFLAQPTEYLAQYDEQVQAVFYEKVHAAIGEQNSAKPPSTLAQEVVDQLFTGLLTNKLSPLLSKVYHNWLDSVRYQGAFQPYLDNFKLAESVDIWRVHPDHPFAVIDQRQLKEVVQQLEDPAYLKKRKTALKARAKNAIAHQFGSFWWTDVLVMLGYNTRQVAALDSLSACIAHYREHFYRVDQAMRRLYTQFLAQESVIAPLQQYYQHHLLAIFMDKWFRYVGNYQQEQTGKLSELIRENKTKTAIVVGDGISYEFALEVKQLLADTGTWLAQEKDYLLAAYPSETENNMSQLYVTSGEVMAIHRKREQALLAAHPGEDIAFLPLEAVNETTDQHQYLILSYKDLDELGEKQQQRALKYFDQMANTLAEKIRQLLRNGYQRVYLVADHGFVLTGLLEESDKIEVQISGKKHTSERYIRTVNDPKEAELISFAQDYGTHHFVSFSKNIAPFKTPGVYGYSHGGLAPQELITPFFCWEAATVTSELTVSIVNKEDLAAVLGNVFNVKLKAVGAKGDLFQAERKVQILAFHAGKQVLKSDIIRIENGQSINKEFEFDGYTSLQLRLIDSISKATLEAVTVEQDQGRDLGGLI